MTCAVLLEHRKKVRPVGLVACLKREMARAISAVKPHRHGTFQQQSGSQGRTFENVDNAEEVRSVSQIPGFQAATLGNRNSTAEIADIGADRVANRPKMPSGNTVWGGRGNHRFDRFTKFEKPFQVTQIFVGRMKGADGGIEPRMRRCGMLPQLNADRRNRQRVMLDRCCKINFVTPKSKSLSFAAAIQLAASIQCFICNMTNK